MKINMKNKKAEVFLYGDIGGFFGITAESFVREIKSLGELSTINLRINSDGGNVFDGVAIYNFLRSHQARVEVDIDSLAASIASIIAMAGDEIRIADNAWMMIHDPWIVTGGTSDELRKTADTMDGIRDTLLDTYMHKTKQSRDDVSEMMKNETWLNAKDAKDKGFVTHITGALDIAASIKPNAFKNTPQNLIEQKPKGDKKLLQIISRMDHSMRKYKI